MAQIKLQNEKLGILKRTIEGAVEHAPDAESWVVRFSATDVSYILEGLDEVAALEQRVEAMKEDGHSMDCDVRKEAGSSPPDCSCGWTQRLEDMAASGEDQEIPEPQTRKVSARRAAEIHHRIQKIYDEGSNEQDSGASRLRQEYWKEWGKPPEGEGPHEDRGGPAYIPWLEQRVEGIDKALKEIADLVDPDDPHDLGGPPISLYRGYSTGSPQ